MSSMKPAAGTLLATLLATGLMLSGCASTDATGTQASAPVYEKPDLPTGSNLPRRAGKPSAAIELDKEAVAGSARGATRGSGPNN